METLTAASRGHFVAVHRLTRHLQLSVRPFQSLHFRNGLDQLLTLSYAHFTGKVPSFTIQDLEDYTRIFFILLDMESPHHVHLFMDLHRSDLELPFTKEEVCSISKLPLEVQTRFLDIQYQYCPIEFSSNISGCFAGRIEPFLEKHVLSSPAKYDADGPDAALVFLVTVPIELTTKSFLEAFQRSMACEASTATPCLPERKGEDTIGTSDASNSEDHWKIVSPPSVSQFIIKQYCGGGIDRFHREIDAYRVLRDVTGFLKYSGWYRCGTLRPNEGLQAACTWNLVLEKGELSLEQIMQSKPPPVLPADISIFWASLLRIAHVLSQLECINVDGVTYNVWHADVKPSNIIRVGNTYKLADPGEAEIRHFQGGKEDAKCVVLGDNVWYSHWQGAPEKTNYFLGHSDTPQEILQNSDIWSLGAVLSVAATYILLGSKGVQDYHDIRREATGFQSDTFHNGTTVLEDVLQWHQHLRKCKGRSDNITDLILDMIDNHMMVQPEKRWSATKVFSHSQSVREIYQCSEQF
ncbi:hypothetical protein G7054_g7300 [Neopestalotiopsis clavispora]|nr:hypothetical protein G7054_g7300 [Neopestalotiopsis clavispora]